MSYDAPVSATGQGLLLVAIAGLLVSCVTTTARCIEHSDCVSDGIQGRCQSNGFCSFPDLECDSGQRYDDYAGGVAGECVPDGDDATSGVATSSAVTSWTITGTSGESTTMATAADGSSTTSGTASGSSTTEVFIAGSCAEIDPARGSGEYTIRVGTEEIAVYCEMELDEGGWTLAYVTSNDGADTWTYGARTLMVNGEAVGNLDGTDRDFKSMAAVLLPVSDLLFVHQPSGIWAAYHDVGDGAQTFEDVLQAVPEGVCETRQWAYPQSAGTLTDDDPALCDTQLYFNRADLDGGTATCGVPGLNATFGPHWNAANNDAACPFDDPAEAGFGPDQAQPDVETPAVGFGRALGLNTGAPGMAENFLQMYVR